VFAEPWQAQVLALAVNLSEQGHFTWTEWTTALGAELKAAADRGEPDDGQLRTILGPASKESLSKNFCLMVGRALGRIFKLMDRGRVSFGIY
jgi:hypothetical protein